MNQQQLKRLKALEEENSKLKRMYADVSLAHCQSSCLPKALMNTIIISVEKICHGMENEF